MKPSDYSGTPLARKLGIKEGFIIQILNPFDHYFELFSDFPADITETSDSKHKKDFIHFFTKKRKELTSEISNLKNSIKVNGMIWISWPKKASKVETDLTGNIVREIGLKKGLVDIKVCAVDDTWSGLKFVIPVKDRNK